MSLEDNAINFLEIRCRSSFGTIGDGFVKSLKHEGNKIIIEWNDYNGKSVTQIVRDAFQEPDDEQYTKMALVDIYNMLVDLEFKQAGENRGRQPYIKIENVNFD